MSDETTRATMLTGNEAIARAVVDSGVKVATSYPGSPTVQILEAIARMGDLYAEWSPSEKVAMEVAIGASMAGAAAFVSMKHVGINISADPLMTFTFSRLNGPLVIAVGDDPGQISSQNEQDSRMWAEYGMMPMLQPGTPQEAYDLTRLAFAISVRFETPVFVRMVDRTCHMMGRVETGETLVREVSGFEPDPVRYYQVPPYSREARALVEGRIPAVQAWLAEGRGYRQEVRDTGLGVVTFGAQYPMIRELLPELSTFKLDAIWPLPLEAFRHAHMLRPGGTVITGADELWPTPVLLENKPMPADWRDQPQARDLRVAVVPTRQLALRAGDYRMVNVVMAGAVSPFLPLGLIQLQRATELQVPPGTYDKNLRALMLGREAGAMQPFDIIR